MEYCSLEKAKEIVAIKYANALQELNLYDRFDMPKVIWKDMGVRRAGYCSYIENTITLNSNYLKSKDWQAFLDDTPLHELAHAISWQLYDTTGHKGMWRSVCHQLGLQGNRCHNFATPEGVDTNKRKRKRYSAHCSCGQHIITSVKYNRIQRGVDYICTRCKTTLVLD